MTGAVRFLHHLDQDVTLAINGLHTPFTDAMWVLFSDRKVWIVLYLALALLLFVRLGWKKSLVVLAAVGLTVLACDQCANLFKYSVARLRPMWDSYMIEGGLRRLEGRSGWYGFFSAHAANAFGVAMYLWQSFRAGDGKRSYKAMGWLLFCWAALVSLSRVFVGKHYLGDVLVGVSVGLLIGYVFGRIVKWVFNKYSLSL